MEEGILTSEQEKTLSALLDDAIKLKGVAEFVDDKFIDKLKEEIKIKLAALVEAVMAEDVELAEQLATELVNSLIDIPGLDEESEGLLFKGVIEIIVGAILQWIESKKGEPVALKLAR